MLVTIGVTSFQREDNNPARVKCVNPYTTKVILSWNTIIFYALHE